MGNDMVALPHSWARCTCQPSGNLVLGPLHRKERVYRCLSCEGCCVIV